MRENFDSELEKIETISKYSKTRACKMLDDMGTAYLSSYSSQEHLDTSLIHIRTAKKYLRSKGFTQAEIEDYMLEKSYISKTDLNRLRTESIYMCDSPSLAPHIENIVDRQNSRTTTDLIIDKLQSNQDLLLCLQKGMRADNLQRKFNLTNTTLLINFYEKHKEII